MESQSHSFVVGLFVLLLGLSAAAGAWWLTPQNHTSVYAVDLLTTHSVAGLRVNAPVRFRGVEVGRVRSIAFDARESGRIRVRIEVDRSAPLTTATYATLGYEGINGVALIQMDDDPHKSRAPLRGSNGALPEMELEPGLLERAEQGVGDVLANTQRVAGRLENFLNDKNEQRLFALIDSLKETSERYGALAQDMAPSAKALPGLVNEATFTIVHTRMAVDDLTRLASDTDRRLGELDTVAEAARHVGQAADDLHRDTLPRLNSLTTQLSLDARELDQMLHQASTRPQSFIFGPEVPAPGPGEPGFASSNGVRR